MNKTLIAATALLGVALSTASAAPRISAQSIIVNPAPQTDVAVKVWVDRDPGGSATPNYNIGDRITIYTQTSADAYVYLFNVNPDGSIDQILPNRYASGGNFVKANTVKAFPSAGDGFTFDISGPYGVNKVLALASKSQLNLNQISSFQSGQPFAQVNVRGQENLAQALSIVVNPVPQDSWITDVAFYNVAGGVAYQPAPVQPAPATGTVIDIDITIRPYAAAQNYRTVNVDRGRRYEFSARNSLQDVFGYYEGEMLRQGYTVQTRDNRGNRIEARYVRNGRVTTLEIKQRGSRFEVNIDQR